MTARTPFDRWNELRKKDPAKYKSREKEMWKEAHELREKFYEVETTWSPGQQNLEPNNEGNE